LRAALALLNLISPIAVKPGSQDQKEQSTAEWEADGEIGEKWRLAHRQALFTNVGLALSQWAGMEDLLVGISCLLLRTHEATKVGIMLYSIANPPTWLSIIGELFSQEPRYITLKPRWNKLSERLIKLNDTRVRLAHHTISPAGDNSLRPSQFDVRPKSQKHRFEPLNYKEISKFIYSLGILQDYLRTLLESMTDILQYETSQQKSSQSTTDQHRP
jgi:hypothetical protein